MSGRIGQPPEIDPQLDPGWDAPWDGRFDRRKPTTAELAVPWLIGIILLLLGIVIVLLALLFTSESGVGIGPTAPTSSVAGSTGTPTETPTGTVPIGGPVTTAPAPSPTPLPFGDLEVAFMAREVPNAPISVMRDDFATEDAPTFVARSDAGVTSHDWAPDGSLCAAIIAGQAVAVGADGAPRPLADNVAQITFGPDATTLYAVRVADDGVTEVSTVVAIDVASAEEREITEVSYDNPVFGFTGPLDEAQFADDGGPVRLYWLADGRLFLDVFAGPSVSIDPADGTQTPVDRRPLLSSPDGSQRVELTEGDAGTTALELLAADGSVQAATSVTGVVSHLRWSPRGDRVAFTVGILTPDGGVRQDLYQWTLTMEEAPTALTSSGAAFGVEWLGGMDSWRV